MNVNEADVEVKIETAARRWLANLKGAASVRVGTVRSRYQVTDNELEATGAIMAELKVCQPLTFWETFFF